MHGLLMDVRYGLRQMRARPVFTATAVLTLALGIGANSTIFSVVNGLILRPLPYEDGDRLVLPWRAAEDGPMLLTPDGALLDAWQQVGGGLAVEAFTNRQKTESGRGDPRILDVTLASAGLFDLLRIRPELGRGIVRADEEPGAPKVILLAHGYWQSAFGGDPGVIGRDLLLDGEAWTIVGVGPAGVVLPAGGIATPDLWAPLPRAVSGLYEPRGLMPVARMPEGMTVEHAQAELSAATRRVVGDAAMNTARVQRPADMLGTSVQRSLNVLMGAVCLVLLIACANVANLLLARGAGRRDEMAVRAAIGAGPGRLLRQLLLESLLLAAAGGIVGIALASWGLDVVIALRPESLRALERVHLDGRVVAFTVLATLFTGLAFGLLPALRASRAAFADRLRGGRVIRSSRTTATLIATEVALSMVLMIGAGLLLRTLVDLENRPLGIDPEGVVTATYRLPPGRYDSPSAQRDFLEQVRAGAAALPGVRAATLTIGVPPAYGILFGALEIEGEQLGEDAPNLYAMNVVEPAYFEVLGIPIVEGRALREEDAGGDAIVVNETFARRYFPDGAVGRRMRTGEGGDWQRIVGVSGDLPTGLGDAERPQLHFPPSEELPRSLLLIDTDATPGALRGPLADIAARVDPAVALDEVSTVEAKLAAALDRPRFNVLLLGALALLALVLSAVGLYGVVSYSVSERTREIGIRRALGAPVADILELVARQGLVPAAIGGAIGLASAFVLTRLMDSMLYGFSARDPFTLAVVPALLAVVAAGACALPARRAARVAPAIALRDET